MATIIYCPIFTQFGQRFVQLMSAVSIFQRSNYGTAFGQHFVSKAINITLSLLSFNDCNLQLVSLNYPKNQCRTFQDCLDVTTSLD